MLVVEEMHTSPSPGRIVMVLLFPSSQSTSGIIGAFFFLLMLLLLCLCDGYSSQPLMLSFSGKHKRRATVFKSVRLCSSQFDLRLYKTESSAGSIINR